MSVEDYFPIGDEGRDDFYDEEPYLGYFKNNRSKMSTIRITLLKTVDINQPNASKTYKQMVVTHQEQGKDKPDGKKIFDFTTPKDVWEILKAAPAGAMFEVDRQKDKKEGKYWEWIAIRPVTGDATSVAAVPATVTATPVPSAGTPTTARVGNWETPEERAAKQVYIVRQSSISAAIALIAANGDGVQSKEEVVLTARFFENYVFGKGVSALVSDMPE